MDLHQHWHVRSLAPPNSCCLASSENQRVSCTSCFCSGWREESSVFPTLQGPSRVSTSPGFIAMYWVPRAESEGVPSWNRGAPAAYTWPPLLDCGLLGPPPLSGMKAKRGVSSKCERKEEWEGFRQEPAKDFEDHGIALCVQCSLITKESREKRATLRVGVHGQGNQVRIIRKGGC